MIHQFDKHKVIHQYDGTTLYSFDYEKVKFITQSAFSQNPLKKILRVLFAYKFQVLIDDKHTASFMIDYKYQFKFDFEENPHTDLFKIINAIQVHFVREFISTAYKIDLDIDTILFNLIDQNKIKVSIDEVILNAKQRNLLRQD